MSEFLEATLAAAHPQWMWFYSAITCPLCGQRTMTVERDLGTVIMMRCTTPDCGGKTREERSARISEARMQELQWLKGWLDRKEVCPDCWRGDHPDDQPEPKCPNPIHATFAKEECGCGADDCEECRGPETPEEAPDELVNMAYSCPRCHAAWFEPRMSRDPDLSTRCSSCGADIPTITLV